MILDFIRTLKEIVREETISVEYYTNGKCYRVPSAAFFLDPTYDPFDENTSDYLSVFIKCEYTTKFGVMYAQCTISDINNRQFIEPICVPLDKKKRTRVHREMASLINMCSKRIISQEMSRNKYALLSAINSIGVNKEYS